jgi:pimeloyl-ACP methyl ester carboxylesterase
VTICSANLPKTDDLDAHRDRYFTTDGARLRYRDEGEGPAVLLVHGWTLDLQMWEPQVAALGDAYRLVRFDRRGFGLSSGRPSGAQDIADIGALCAHLAIDRVALVGMSQGVRAVCGFARAAAQKISCLIFDGPPDPDRQAAPADDDVPFSHYLTVVRERGIAAFRSEWAAHPLLTLRSSDPRVRELLAAMLARYPGRDLLEPAAGADAPPSAPPGRPIDAPVLVLTGRHDLASRTRAADELAARIPTGERARIEEAGHLPNLDNPAAYNAVVRAFLDRHTAHLR